MQMWATFAVIGAAIVLFALERAAVEVIALGVIVALLLLFYFFPVIGPSGAPAITPEDILAGFANPALITILGLLVIGQALHQTGALEELSNRIVPQGRKPSRATLWLLLLMAAVISAFMNNTPVVVIFIPVLAALANRAGAGAGRVLMPLSYVCILGGMTTLIGSSTNLLVANAAMREIGYEMSFFELTVPGTFLAAIGIIYALLVVPRLLHRNGGASGAKTDAQPDAQADGRQFLAQLEVTPGHPLEGMGSVAGLFPALRDITVLKLERHGQALLPPYEDLTFQAGDTLVVAATRQALTALLKVHPKPTGDEAQTADPATATGPLRQPANLLMAEAAVAPNSRLEGRFLQHVNFKAQTGCTIIGLQRHRRMLRGRLDTIRLQAGDVILILGPQEKVLELRSDRDLLVLEGSVTRVPHFAAAAPAIAIFALTVFAAATGLVPVVIAALCGAAASIVSGSLNVRQAARALDPQIVLLVAASIAMARALETTGGASFLAHHLVEALAGQSAIVILSAMFLLVAVTTNVLSNNATALLFTPIAIGTAAEIGADPVPFIHAVIFAANCPFATPIGYQTNLLVMSPGNYRFMDFVRTGTPLLIIMWLAFTILAPWYYGI
ncbi:MAG TPA: SLC13 family permease [Aestuariivirgaceae bacterium]|nr:SLC13 family permease [Aestuariivirgaceae bacterium]